MEVRERGTRGPREECIGKAPIGGKMNDDVEELRGLFDKIVLFLCKEAGGNEKIDPFPPCLSNGRTVDLFKLFEAVRIRGGCKRVNETGMWDSVAVELGVSCGILEVIYMKYLKELDQRLSKISTVKGSQIGKGGTERSLDQLKLIALEVQSKCIGDHKLRLKEADVCSNSVIADSERNDPDSMIMEFAQVLLGGGGAMSDYRDNDKKVFSSKTGAVNKAVGSRKRKRGSVHDMLNWVNRIAKHPMKSASEINQKSNSYYAQSLLARQVLFVKGPEGGKGNSQVQNNVKVMPSYYDDANCFNNQSVGILRYSKRVSTMGKSFLEGESDQLPLKLCFQVDIENVKAPFKPKPCLEDSTDTIITFAQDVNYGWIDDIPTENHSSLGPKYQDEVREWTGLVTESDSKWLGTRIWPVEEQQNNALDTLVHVGRGRPNSCNCKFPGSVTCTRFHIAEKKLELKLELGSVFYLWRFDQMGEDYALSWSSKEESRFMQMVRRNPPSSGNCFWDCAPRYLRRKARSMVVNYYFNVFVLRRRCYQNHVTPNEIDSDDDDNEFELLDNLHGEEDISPPDKELSTCNNVYARMLHN